MSTLYLPAWSIGPDCYQEVYDIVRTYGKKVAVIGGHTAMSKSLPKLKAALQGTDLELSEPIWFGGEASYENAAMLEALPEVKNADMVFAIGGGRAMDTAKCAAGHLDKPLFAFPTLGSNCASCTTLCVMYYPDGAMKDLYYPKRCAIHTFMDSEIIANSPAEYLWAGIGDSLAKEFESEFAARNDLADFKIQHAPLMGTAIARCCTPAFLNYGVKAMEQIRNHEDGYELQQVVLGIVITAGMVSNLTVETHNNDYFYNDSIAHGFYYGCTVCPGAHKHLHGEVVSLGILVLLTLDKQFAQRDKMFPFYKALGLPMTMDDIELPLSDLPTLVDKSATMSNWNYVPTPITKEQFTQAILDTDAAAKAWLAANK
ncbi:iron-containing alcohol dehydrogenase family protein [Oscillibacter sp.]|uniref:iron-containing alcohol dehydrogenase family protein n=1 Tax=Oscillibacter sp. TaxID=1945593 RepID=UPI002611B487|nr:iron-containing alcohol dehydrogenase family protein [Oscillibacter sp.]MDD3346202.1 iron-containing alcohol dehydrogenase family protein [Oscillibacter sp.]